MNRLRRLLCVFSVLTVLLGASPAAALEIPEPTLSPHANPYNKEEPLLLEPDQLYAASAILMEASTGQVIFEKNPDAVMYPASTTKILTGLLAIEAGNLDQMCEVSNTAITFYEDDVSTIDLREGEKMSMIDLLYGTLMESGNDAANVVAEHVGGSIDNFVQMMNAKAASYGCKSTHFTNPTGLHNDQHYTTARDMATITRMAMQNETFRTIVGATSYKTSATNIMRARTFNTTAQVMVPSTSETTNKYYYPDAIGVKTGTTSMAGYCFVGAAERDGVTLISVLFFTGKRARWADTIKLMDYGFAKYTSVTPVELYNMNPITVETSNYSLDDRAMGKLSLTCVPAVVGQDAKIIATHEEVEMMADNLRDTVLIQYTRDFVAPIEIGEIMGTMTYFTNDGTAVEYNLLAARTVPRRENAPKTLEEIVAETEADPNPFPPLTVETALYFLWPLIVLWLIISILRRILKRRRVRTARMPKPKSRYLK